MKKRKKVLKRLKTGGIHLSHPKHADMAHEAISGMEKEMLKHSIALLAILIAAIIIVGAALLYAYKISRTTFLF